MSLISELKRRNVFRVSTTYVVVGWLFLQVSDVLLDFAEAPAWIGKVIIALLALGFFVALTLSWLFDITPEGIRRDDGSTNVDGVRARRLNILTIFAAIGVASIFAWQQLRGPGNTTTTAPQEAAVSQSSDAAAKVGVDDVSIAVLPFIDLSQEGDQEFFADGISEEILNVLVRIPKLKVAGRTSSFSFKGKDQDLREIRAALGVDHVLEGSVRLSGTRLRITAQLIRGEDGFQLWSETYDREQADIFDIQDEIARAVADQLAVTLGLSSESLVRERTEDLVAYENYLKAQQLFLKRGKDNLDMALLLAGEAAARDPDYAPAWGVIARVYTAYESYQEQVIDESVYLRWRALGKAAAKRAIALDPNNGDYYRSLGSFYNTERRWQEAFAEYDRALQLSPDNADVHDSMAQNLIDVGYFAEANEHARRATALDPLVAIYRNTLGRTYIFTGEVEAALDAFEKGMELGPQFRFPYSNTWLIHARAGDLAKAAPIIEKAVALGVYPPEASENAERIRLAYDNEDALRALIGKFKGRPSHWYNIMLRRKLGDYDSFMDDVVARWANKTSLYLDLFNEEVPPELYAYPRWKEQVKKEGLLDLWRARGFPAHCRPLEGDDFECDNYELKTTL